MTYLITFLLVCLSALFSGLTLGFFSLQKDDLKRKAELGDISAQKIYKLRKRGNLLLCTLLIGNVAVNTTLSIFLSSFATGFTAGLIATGLIVIFGEITPQAIFSRHALKLGSKLTWIVWFFVVILFPICWPIAWILNRLLGKELPTIYSKEEIVKMIEFHEDSKRSDIDADEEKLMKGVLTYSEKNVSEIMTPIEKAIVLEGDSRLNIPLIRQIRSYGHSRIPVYKDNINKIVGILFVKDLVGLEPDKKDIKNIARKQIIHVRPDRKLDNLLNDFKRTHKHLFIVADKGKVLGLVTIEDVLEEIMGDEIIDEFD